MSRSAAHDGANLARIHMNHVSWKLGKRPIRENGNARRAAALVEAINRTAKHKDAVVITLPRTVDRQHASFEQARWVNIMRHRAQKGFAVHTHVAFPKRRLYVWMEPKQS